MWFCRHKLSQQLLRRLWMDKTYYPDKKKKKHSFNNISLSLISMFAKLSQMRVSMEKKKSTSRR